MDTEWIDARIDGSDLRVGDAARLVWGYTEACHGIVTDFKTNGVCMEPGVSRKPVMYGRDRTGDEWRWQYHAPTRAKLEAADRERVTVTSITSDAITVQPAPPPDSEPGWDHVPAEYVHTGNSVAAIGGDRFYCGGMGWKTLRAGTPLAFEVARHNYWIRRGNHPARVRWLEERGRALNSPPSAAYVGKESAYARATSTARCPRCWSVGFEGAWCSCVTESERERHYANIRDGGARAATATLDPFAAVRAEAKRMMDEGANPRVVLGALDACIRRGDAATWNSYLALHASRALDAIVLGSHARALEPCYHGNRAGTCGWCALSRDRSDARAVAPHEPVWETADCEGE